MDSFDLIVVGAGPGGYACAIRAAQLGQEVALVERGDTLGGTCLNVGCIPSKALLESSHHFSTTRDKLAQHGIKVSPPEMDLGTMLARKDQVVGQLTSGIAALMKKNKVVVCHGQGRLIAPDKLLLQDEDGERELSAPNIVLATGSAVVELPGLAFDGQRTIDSTDALALDQVPEHLVVVGGGAVGLELGLVWLRLGAKVTVVEALDRIVPFADKMFSRMLMRALKAQGMEFLLKARVEGASPDGAGLAVDISLPKDEQRELSCDKLLVSVGRKPYFEGLGLSEVGVALDAQGRVSVDQQLRTSVQGIWAIGDLIPGPMLAHKAEEEGIAVAERIAGLPGHVAYDKIPSVVYTWPELAQVGLTEEQAKEQGLSIRTGKFYLRANGRALAAGESEGLVKVIAHAQTDAILGVHILGPNASELIAQSVLALEFGASAEDLARTIHAHPTLSEAVKEAALAVDGRAIHA